MKGSIVLVAGVLLAFTGCGGSHGAKGPLSSDERLWVRHYERWLNGTQRAATNAEEIRRRVLGGGTGTRADYDEAVAPVRRCRKRYDEAVGEAPTARLRAVQKLALEACSQYQRAARAESQAFNGPPGDFLLEAETAISKGNGVWLEADRKLEAMFAWNRPLPVRTGEAGVSRIEPRFGRVASTLANRPVQVRCWSPADWAAVFEEWRAFTADEHAPIGFVASFDRGRLSLAPDICERLAAFTYGGGRPQGFDAAQAVETLAHEAEHLVSPGTEAETECYGMQDIRRTARLLGADRAYADQLAEAFWRDVYPVKPSDYRTPLCRDGGPLDRNRSSSVWP